MRKRIDLSGQKFGALTAVRRVETGSSHPTWEFVCDCGNTKVTDSYLVVSGGMKSCGCLRGQSKRKDISGQRFGSLVAIRFSGTRFEGRYKKSFWEFRCDCGNVKEISRGNVVAGSVRTCGCRGFWDGQVNFNLLYLDMKGRAKQRGLEFNLTKEQVHYLTKQNCFYCGNPPSYIWKTYKYKGMYIYNGVDRIDSGGGYVEGNVVTCCAVCNLAKHIQSIEDFRSWVVRVYNHWAQHSSLPPFELPSPEIRIPAEVHEHS